MSEIGVRREKCGAFQILCRRSGRNVLSARCQPTTSALETLMEARTVNNLPPVIQPTLDCRVTRGHDMSIIFLPYGNEVEAEKRVCTH
jgi:hypothetical protein